MLRLRRDDFESDARPAAAGRRDAPVGGDLPARVRVPCERRAAGAAADRAGAPRSR
jgi:hypothetical protein